MFKKIGNAIRRAYRWLMKKSNKLIPVAINIVEGIKVVMDTQADDIIALILKKVIKGKADDIIIDKARLFLETKLPVLLSQLVFMKTVVHTEDPNEQLKLLLLKLKDATKDVKKAVYLAIAAQATEFMSDGKLSWEEATILSQQVYNALKKK
jgi:hypothetical protein